MEHVALIDRQRCRSELLMYLVEERIEDVRMDCFPSLEDARCAPRPAAVMLNSLEPGERGEIPPDLAERLRGIAFDGPGLIVICSAYLQDPVFETGVRHLAGPHGVVSIQRTTLDWTARAIAALDGHLRRLRAARAGRHLFPQRAQPQQPWDKLEPSTELVILKRLLKGMARRDSTGGEFPLRKEFLIHPERYLNGEDGYSLA